MKSVLSALCGLAALISTGALAQSSGEDGPVFGAWKVQCQTAGNCQAFLSLANPKDNKLALSAAFFFVEGAPSPTGVVTLPLGIALRPGVHITAGETGDPINLKAEVCYPDGCRMVFNFLPEDVSRIVAEPAFRVAFFAYGGEEKPSAIDVPTNGLEDALAYISDKQSAGQQ